MGLRRVTWAPRISESSAEIATIVGLCLMPDFQMSCNRSEEASPSQSIRSRSVLPSANMPRALEELKQRFVQTEKSRSNPSIVENTAGSREMNKHSKAISSVVTPKPANGGRGKTGQREEAGDSVVLSCRLLWWQVYFRTPTPRTTFEYMTVMEKAIEHGGDGGAISQ